MAAAAPSAAAGAATPQQLVAAGRTALKEGRVDDARKSFESASKLDGSNAAAQAGLGDVAFQQTRFPDAVKFHRGAVKLSPSNAEYLVALGMDFFKLEQYDFAKSQWNKALQIDSHNEKAAKYLKIVEKKLNP